MNLIIDSIMGSGKTTWAIRYMNLCPQRKFIFATPFLEEDKRIRENYSSLHFVSPDGRFSKLSDLKRLIAEGKNIATTHALLDVWIPSPSDIENLHRWNYTLILDEAIEVITPVQGLNKDDYRLLLEQMISLDPQTKQVRWIAETCPQRYQDIKKLAAAGRLFLCRNCQLLNLMPPKLLKAMPNVIIMTFLFEASHLYYYLRLQCIRWNIAHIRNGRLVMGAEDLAQKKREIRSLLSIYEGKYNQCGNDGNSLSATFWSDPRKRSERHNVLNKIRSFFLTFCAAHVNQCMWAVFKAKDRADANIVPGFKTSFVSFNSRATNTLSDRCYLAYAVNIFDHPFIISWFADHGQTVNNDLYALSAMLQWIWRSAIRNGQRVSLFLPSKRMRVLLTSWLNS